MPIRLSRLPVKEISAEDVFDINEEEVFDIDHLANSNISNKRLREAVSKDKTLNQVIHCLKGTPCPCPEDLKPYFVAKKNCQLKMDAFFGINVL